MERSIADKELVRCAIRTLLGCTPPRERHAFYAHVAGVDIKNLMHYDAPDLVRIRNALELLFPDHAARNEPIPRDEISAVCRLSSGARHTNNLRLLAHVASAIMEMPHARRRRRPRKQL